MQRSPLLRFVLLIAILISSVVSISTPNQVQAATAVYPPPLSPPPAANSLDARLEMAEMRAVQSSLTTSQRAAIDTWDQQAVARWNKLARDLVAGSDTDPITASRVYWLLSRAQAEALQLAQREQIRFAHFLPDPSQSGITPLVSPSPTGSYPSEHATIASASATVLQHFFGATNPMIEAYRSQHQESRLWAGVNCRSDLRAGDQLGRAIGQQLLSLSDQQIQMPDWNGEMPTTPGSWVMGVESYMGPLMPYWGTIKPNLIERGDQFRAPPPPVFGSPAFQSALAEVQTIANNRTDEQIRIAKFWADGRFTQTPPGHWNLIALELIQKQPLPLAQQIRIMEYLNAALMDSGIAIWDSKYTYWYIRPWQADPQLNVLLNRPPHPSYPSGHSGFSAAGATFLAAVFPAERDRLWAMAVEASRSRVYGGIHYSFDCDAGLVIGQQVGAVAAARYQAAQAVYLPLLLR